VRKFGDKDDEIHLQIPISTDDVAAGLLLIGLGSGGLQCFDAVGWAAGRASGL